MTRKRLCSVLLTVALVGLAGGLWEFFAPLQIGGSTAYVITHGVSMEPRFHTGDLALVRPASSYRVGEVVAYHSSLLHVVVLHRIIAIRNGHYTFKGDHNSFLDPVHPTRSQLIGTPWLRVPHGGEILGYLHTPITAAVLAGIIGLVLVGLGPARRRGRGDRRPKRAARPAHRGGAPMSADTSGTSRTAALQTLLIAVSAAALLFGALTLVAFSQPTRSPKTHQIAYRQNVHFSYSASVPVGPVYPHGAVRTGDPIFLNIVHRLGVRLAYDFSAPVPASLRGTEQTVLHLSGSNGWSREKPLGPPRRFTGGHVVANVAFALAPIQALFAQIERLTAVPAVGSTITVVAKIHVRGQLAGHPIDSNYSQSTSFVLNALQLTPGTTAPASGSAAASHSVAPTAVSSTVMVAHRIGFAGVSIAVAKLRPLALVLLLVSLAIALVLGVLLLKNRAFDESARIQAKYGQLIVPISAGTDLGWPAIDVGDISALVRLAQAGGQLILHNHDDDADTFLVNDEGTVYRYQVQLPKVVWGEWTKPSVEAEQLAA